MTGLGWVNVPSRVVDVAIGCTFIRVKRRFIVFPVKTSTLKTYFSPSRNIVASKAPKFYTIRIFSSGSFEDTARERLH